MKNQLLFLAMFAFSFPVFCQTGDTTFISVSQENGALESPRFLNQYDKVFGTMQPTRVLAKLNVIPALLPLGEYALDEDDLITSFGYYDFNSISKVELSVEWKMSPALSLQATGIVPARGSAYFKGHFRGAGLRIEPRWYYNMPRRIRAGQSANNVSGNYIGLDYQTYRQKDETRNRADSYMRYQFQVISLRYGIQRRLFRYGFIDMSVGAGYHKTNYEAKSGNITGSQPNDGIFLETKVAAGLAFGAPRTPKSDVVMCDVLRCFQEEKHMWKISLEKAFRINQDGSFSNPRVSYEQKLGASPFSIETEAEVFLATFRYIGEGLDVRKYGAGINVQPRWYFLQKRRIAKGKSGNNLSGLFTGIMGGYRRTERPGVSAVFYPDQANLFYAAPHVGIQHRLFKNGFVQFKFGVLYDIGFAKTYGSLPDPSSFLSELHVGLAF
jgi:hypothetical protein